MKTHGFSLLEILIALGLASSMILIADYAMTEHAKANAKITQQYQAIFS